MPDRADEIAREVVDAWAETSQHQDPPSMEHRIAAALRAYADEKLEEAAKLLQMSFPTVAIDSLGTAAVLVRSLKSQP